MNAPLPAVWPDDMPLADVIAFFERELRDRRGDLFIAEHGVAHKALQYLRVLSMLMRVNTNPLGLPDGTVLDSAQTQFGSGGGWIRLVFKLPDTPEAAEWTRVFQVGFGL